jgi:dihydroneopterin aldolase/2-amino-4-hydroxy-6-hydroxymethyldihydropteridine diphosphokinase/dihydropteroate synthase
MYVTDQDIFTNGVIEIATALSPIALLRLLKRTETEVGRTKTFRNGPRVLDLDLVAYGDEVVSIGEPGDAADADGVAWLRVPHASVTEREFVLRPLADIDAGLLLPGVGVVDALLANVAPGGLAPIIPFLAPAQPLRLAEPGQPATPAIMAIFNATPDSFSDGAVERTRAETALTRAEEVLAAKPAILDIGGMSTRPGAEPCSEAEEVDRVVPLITALRAAGHKLPISVDTYRPSVAAAAIAAGASCINDVRAGREEGMFAAMAAADAPVVLMHSRGDSMSMLAPESHIYPSGVVSDVAAELGAAADAARAAGVKRWDIVLDPGLGFAKSQAQNLALLRDLRDFADNEHAKGYALLVGASRKRFVGAVSGIAVPSERGPADAAVNAVCAAAGVVDVLRVHATEEARATVAMAAAIRDADEGL